MSASLRLSAADRKLTCRPSPEIVGEDDESSPGAPAPFARLSRVVLRPEMWRRKTFVVNGVTVPRLLAVEVKATKPPPAEMTGSNELPSAGASWVPEVVVRLMCVRSFSCGSAMNTLVKRSRSSLKRLSASEANAIRVPSFVIDGSNELPSPPAPAEFRLISVVVFVSVLRVNTSVVASASSVLRFVARDSNAITAALALTVGSRESPSAAAPSVARLTSLVVPSSESCR